ncbi:MAG: hypothetical protein EA001_14915 [Oscillatoriales cyanobacterium]|nr:MAG: hypothetical protein EA001_14915 [Oscillatoriales cyanobacterium]
MAKSWFLTNLFTALFTAQSPNSQPIAIASHEGICSPSFVSSPVECTDSEATGRRSRKIRIFLNPEQKALLKQWLGVSRFVYNTTIKHLQELGTKAN